MAKRKYKIKDVYDYLLEAYNFEWRKCVVLEDGKERGVRSYDFGGYTGKYEDKLSVVIIVYSQGKRQPAWLIVTNESLGLGAKEKPTIEWKDFLAQRYSQEQDMQK